jgi:hypothetical protein
MLLIFAAAGARQAIEPIKKPAIIDIKPMILQAFLVAGIGFEPMTFRL